MLGGREDEEQPLQRVNSFMAELFSLKQLHESTKKLLQLRLLDVSGRTNREAGAFFNKPSGEKLNYLRTGQQTKVALFMRTN